MLSLLQRSIHDLDINSHCIAALTNGGFRYVGDIVRLTEAEAADHLSRHKRDELRRVLKHDGLHFGMTKNPLVGEYEAWLAIQNEEVAAE